MTKNLQHTASQEDSKEFQENTLYVFLSSVDHMESNFQRIGLISKDKISESLMDKIIDGCTLVEEKNEVGSLFPYLDVLICPSVMATALNDKVLDNLTVYLDDILLANDTYHKKSIIQFILADDDSIITSEGNEYLKELLSKMIINNKNQKVKILQ